MDSHSAPPAEAAAAAPAGDGPAPVQANHHSHAVHHDQPNVHPDKDTPKGQLTPRPTFLANLAGSREAQFMLDRRNSSELDRYFVCPFL